MVRSILVAACLTLGAAQCVAQVATGVYQYGAFDNHSFDSVNVGNLNVHFGVPVLNKAGRANLPFSYTIAYDSSVWTPVSLNGNLSWAPVASFGWGSVTSPVFGYVTAAQTESQPSPCVTDTYYDFQYHDPGGVIHSFPGSATVEIANSGASCPASSASLNATAIDNSGYQLYFNTANTLTTVSSTSQSASSYPAPLSSRIGPAAGTLTDSNGNQISADSNGNFTDTTGHVVLQPTSSAYSQTLTYNDTSGNSQEVTINFSFNTIQTAFGCSGITEYGTSLEPLVSSIILADGSSYSFTYEPTPGTSNGAVTGRIASVTLPGGGIIGYSYTGSNNGINCADGSAAGLTRTMLSDSPNTSWTYSRSVAINGSNTSHSNVVDGIGNNYDYDFVAPTFTTNSPSASALFYEVNTNSWNGAASGAHALSQATCYNGSGSFCVGTAISLPITQMDTYTTLSDLEQNGTTITYNSSGLQTGHTTYDYGVSANNGSNNRGPALSVETFGYGACGPSTLVSSDTVTDGNSNILSHNTYCYDQTTPSTSSNVPSHVAVSGARGNLTTLTTQTGSGSPALTTTYTYEDTGSVLTSTDSVNGTTTFTYDPTYTYTTQTALPTPSSGVGMTTEAGFDTANTGLLTSTTDLNNQSTLYGSYDQRLRPLTVSYPDGGQTTYAYTPTALSIHTYQTSSVYVDNETQLDGYGRTVRRAVRNASGSYYQQDTCYDGNGNVKFRAYTYASSSVSSSLVCSGSGDSYTYDVLGRVASVTHGDGSNTSIQFVHTGRATQKTDENGVTTISQVDGLGRPTVICEISSTTLYGTQTPGSCGTDISGTGFITSYGYGYSGGYPTTTTAQGSQIRSSQTDWAGRTVSTSEPERGLTSYTYSANSTGAVVTRTRPQANQTNSSVLTTTTTQYDTLSRPIRITYADGNTSIPNYMPTQERDYLYDLSQNWYGDTPKTNLVGRLSLERAGPSPWVNSNYSYDAMGRTLHISTCRPSTCGQSADFLAYTYDLAGNQLTSSDGNNVSSTYTYTVANELSSLVSSQSNSQNPAAILYNVTQGVFGPTGYSLGNSGSVVPHFDTMGRYTGSILRSGAAGVCHSASCGDIVSWKGKQAITSADEVGQTITNYTYSYDTFNRLQTVSAGGTQTYSYAYDRWGNRWSGSSAPTYSTDGSNHISTLPYDAAGNLTQDAAGNSYFYDAEGNVLEVNAGTSNPIVYTYDALNHRVGVAEGSTVKEYDFNTYGQRVSIWLGGSNNLQGQYYWGQTPVAYYEGGSTHFQHQDWVGTERMRTSYNGSIEAMFTQGPFGENYTVTQGSDTDDAHYAGQDNDDATQTSHAQYRELATIYGRWMSADPYDGSYSRLNPQSLNRYSYAMNNPYTFTDRLGLDTTTDPCDVDACVTTDPPDAPPLMFDPPAQQPTPVVLKPTPAPAPNNLPPAVPYNVCVAAAMNTQLTSDKTAVDKANAEVDKTIGFGALLAPFTGYAAYGMGGNAVTSWAIGRSFLAGVYVKAYAFSVGPLLSSMAQASSQYKKDVQSCGHP